MAFIIKDFSMQAFNNDVNHSGDLDDKYKKWTDYRNKVAAFIGRRLNEKDIEDSKNGIKKQAAKEAIDVVFEKPSEEIEQQVVEEVINENSEQIIDQFSDADFLLDTYEDIGTAAIIFAAGECNDLDLEKITDKFDRVVLTDVDTTSIYEGIKRQNISQDVQDKLKVKHVEYTGLAELKFFETLADIVSKAKPLRQVILHIQTLEDMVFDPQPFSELQGKFDFAICSPAYTQLVYTQMEVLLQVIKRFDVYSDIEIEQLNQTVYRKVPGIIARYNDLVLSTLKPDGRVIMLTDVVEIPQGHKMITQLQARLAQKKVDHHELFKFVRDFGLELGVTGYQDLKKKVQLTDAAFMLWPFDEHKQYLVLQMCGKKQI
jgi:hypothetical protein